MMTEKEWGKICKDVANKMSEHIKNFTTPISRELSEVEGEHLGTGSYFCYGKKKFLITNEHVAIHLKRNSLTHKFENNENLLKLNNPIISLESPVDVAIFKIENSNWEHFEHTSYAIPLDRFSQTHSPVDRELLFFIGYSGERSKFYFNNLKTSGTPYLTQKLLDITSIDEANPEFHFALHYRPDKATSVNSTSSLPDPHGFSGSLVWDTKAVACLNEGKEWSPDLAQVTGIVWGWPSSAACILVTKVEYFGISDLMGIMKNNI